MLKENVELIKTLKEGLSAASCLPKDAFMVLGQGQAPALNYNIPQSASFTTYGSIIAKGISANAFLPHTKLPVKGGYFDTIKSLDSDGLRARIAQSVQLQRTDDPLVDGALVRKYMNVSKSNLQAASLSGLSKETTGNEIVSPLVQDSNNAANEIQLANIATDGMQPMIIEKMGGFATKMGLLAEPKNVVPYLAVIEEYTTSAFLGDYGAGRTLSTFSLLPAEKTTLSVKTFRDSTTTKAYSENVLDSFSESSATELEKNIESESGYADSTTNGTSDTNTSSRAANVSASLNGNLFKLVKFGVNAGYNSASSNSSTNSTSATRASNVRNVNKALDKHVANSNANRQIQVNSSTTSSVREGEETSTVRELVNLNKSRVLNYVFRQLLQEYITITYLSNIRFVFCNGYKDSIQIVEVEELDKLLEDNVSPEFKESVRATLLKNYCSIFNYKDEEIPFVEQKIQTIGQCFGEPQTEKFWRRKKNIVDSYIVNPNTGWHIDVPGPILHVDKQTLQTESIIADAILGQGEALDCYGMKTQDAATVAEQLKNLELVQKMEFVDQITDPIARADAYKKIFGTCCDKPQTQII